MLFRSAFEPSPPRKRDGLSETLAAYAESAEPPGSMRRNAALRRHSCSSPKRHRLVADRDMVQHTSTHTAVREASPALAGIRILLFSAESAARERLASALRRSGAQILAAPPGAEAVHACHTFRPQLIVAARVPYAECARLMQALRDAGVAGTAMAIDPAADTCGSAEVPDVRLEERFEEELTGLLIRLLENSRDSP